MNLPKIAFVGMTHLGLVSAVAAAEKGFNISCFDFDCNLIEDLKKYKLNIAEPNLEELMIKNQDKLFFSSNFSLLKDCEIIYVAPDIKTDDEGRSDLAYIELYLKKVFEVTNSTNIVVILSQVPPGFTREHRGQNRVLYYQVETLVFGQALNRSLFPERFIVGCENPDKPLLKSLRIFLEAYDCPILQMRYESAELAKISINMFLVSSVTTSNLLAEICEAIGANWAEILPALKLDRRIGEFAYLNAGLGISGGNLERDLNTIVNLSKKNNIDDLMIKSWKKNSRKRKDWIWSILKLIGVDANLDLRIAILGLTYKENTHSLKNSPALVLLNHLKNHNLIAYDPMALKRDIPRWVNVASSMNEAIKGSDVLILSTAWPEFKDLPSATLKKIMRGNVVIDPYGLLPDAEYTLSGFKYYRLGNFKKN